MQSFMQSQTSNTSSGEQTELLTQEKEINPYQDQIQKLAPPKPTYNQVSPSALKPHQWNSSIYGDTEDVSDLVAHIERSRWIKPLVVTPTGTIISGHRRWKAALELGLETVPVEVREFLNQTAELEALLLSNASRFKTIEQKVREAQAWKEVETSIARRRQIELAGSRPRTQKSSDLQPNLAEGYEKGQTRDQLASRVGLKRTTYEKAAKVVRAIDVETSQGKVEHASALRKILNEQSVDAAVKILKQPCEQRYQILSLIGASQAKNTREAMALIQQSQDSAQKPLSQAAPSDSTQGVRSCWNCQHRLESVDNQSIYCNKFGILNLTNKSGDSRGQECLEWTDRSEPLETLKKETFVLKLFLPPQWQDRLEATAASLSIDAATWVTKLIGASLFPDSDFGERSDDNAKVSIGGDIAIVRHPGKNESSTLEQPIRPAPYD